MLLAIVVVAIFIRIHNFHDWLYFEADQARNAKNSVVAIEDGVKNLPLLGPKAGGTNFHLGPVSYYFEYASGLIFGIDSPDVFAFSNFFFLILSIPLFYYFLRHFFSKGQSLLVTAVLASSYLMAQYARFSWNPNAIIFWGLLFILSIYKVVFEKNKNKAGTWLLVASLSYGVASQLHTFPLLGFPLVALIFWAFYRPVKVNWKYWIGAVLILIAVYSPLIAYDINMHGSNVKEFTKAFSVKTEERGFFEKAHKTVEQYGKYYSLIILSVNDKEVENIKWFSCLIILASVVVGVILWKRDEKDGNGKPLLPRSFLSLILIWFLVFFVLNYSLAFKINQPRFWFSAFFLPYILLSILIFSIWKNKTGRVISVFVCGIIIILNLSAIFNWYEGLENQNSEIALSRTISSTSLMQNDFIVYGEMENAVDWMVKESGRNKVCFNSPSTYLASYKFIFNRNYPDFNAKRINKTIETELADNCDIFIVDHNGNSLDKISDKFSKKGVLINLEKGAQFGLITVWKGSF